MGTGDTLSDKLTRLSLSLSGMICYIMCVFFILKCIDHNVDNPRDSLFALLSYIFANIFTWARKKCDKPNIL